MVGASRRGNPMTLKHYAGPGSRRVQPVPTVVNDIARPDKTICRGNSEGGHAWTELAPRRL